MGGFRTLAGNIAEFAVLHILVEDLERQIPDQAQRKQIFGKLNTYFRPETCSRQIVVLPKAELEKLPEELKRSAKDIFTGENAYKFMLELFCGLHSRDTAETEISGQIRLAWAEYKTSHKLKTFLNPVIEKILEDGNKIRRSVMRDVVYPSFVQAVKACLMFKPQKVMIVAGVQEHSLNTAIGLGKKENGDSGNIIITHPDSKILQDRVAQCTKAVEKCQITASVDVLDWQTAIGTALGYVDCVFVCEHANKPGQGWDSEFVAAWQQLSGNRPKIAHISGDHDNPKQLGGKWLELPPEYLITPEQILVKKEQAKGFFNLAIGRAKLACANSALARINDMTPIESILCSESYLRDHAASAKKPRPMIRRIGRIDGRESK